MFQGCQNGEDHSIIKYINSIKEIIPHRIIDRPPSAELAPNQKDSDSLPDELKVTATLNNNKDIIMGIEHKEKPIYGVQFHPESIDTENGKKLIDNFINMT